MRLIANQNHGQVRNCASLKAHLTTAITLRMTKTRVWCVSLKGKRLYLSDLEHIEKYILYIFKIFSSSDYGKTSTISTGVVSRSRKNVTLEHHTQHKLKIP